ncbi:glycosyltransferase family 4 protein [Psychroserpens burtonensis]|uniref:Glycosyltransferase family 4 protein n=1 Tax=Psychroserpens burtonensis TaxID=49278 RepID=A0A5C7BDT8_9FLAO|nr:glycosyltransferase [Psychroserpens burtonensis]TXE18859.1 glycosyltransferase family 4 protein [Psychroserpens burtonensis]
MKKPKLYLIGPTESVLTKRGNRFPNMAKFFVEEGEEVIYYTSNFYHAEKRFFSKYEVDEATQNLGYKLKVLNVLGYYTNVSPRRVLSNFLFSVRLFVMLLFKVSKQDKILLPSRPVELIFFMALLKKIKGVKIYLDIQDIWPDALQIKNKRKKRVFEIYCNTYLKPSLKHYTGALHVAPSFRLWLRRYAKKTPSSFVPLGWENERWSDVTLKAYKESSVVKMVCVAQLQHQIDIMPILEVLKNNDKLHLTILGEDGTGERYHEVINYINAHLITNIEIIGKIERKAMMYYLENKDIGVLPMITSSIPNKIFDYMAAMLPIIVLGDNDSSNFVVENKIGWQCNFNSKDLDVLLQRLNTSDIQTKKNQVVSIRDNFSRDILHKKIKEMIA